MCCYVEAKKTEIACIQCYKLLMFYIQFRIDFEMLTFGMHTFVSNKAYHEQIILQCVETVYQLAS